MPWNESRISASVENDGGYLSLIFTLHAWPLDRCICIAKKKTGARIAENSFTEIPDFISRLGLRIVHGISRFEPLVSIRGTEHPETAISFYNCMDRFGRRRKVAWTTGSEMVGSLFFVIPDQDYDEIVTLVSELSGTQSNGNQFDAPIA